jgi:hypothetical protein
MTWGEASASDARTRRFELDFFVLEARIRVFPSFGKELQV